MLTYCSQKLLHLSTAAISVIDVLVLAEDFRVCEVSVSCCMFIT